MFLNNDKNWQEWKTFKGRHPKRFNLDPNWHKPWPMWKMVLNTIFIIIIALVILDCSGPAKEIKETTRLPIEAGGNNSQ